MLSLHRKITPRILNVLVNAISSTSGGGLAIYQDLAQMMSERSGDNSFTVIAKATDTVQHADYVNVIKSSRGPFWINFFVLPRLCDKLGVDVVLNLTDLPTLSTVPEVFFFDWAYACYPKSEVWKRMRFADYMHRTVKLALIKRTIRRPRMVTVQIPSMEERLRVLYGIGKCRVIPSPVSFVENSTTKLPFEGLRHHSNQKLLFFPASFTTHKNHQVLLPLAEHWRDSKESYKVVITIDPLKCRSAKQFLTEVRTRGLEDFIVNVSTLTRLETLAAYRVMDGLLMPTLLESYGLPLVEAMMSNLPVFVSDFPFTRDVCSDSAFYFNPFSAASIRHVLNEGFSQQTKILDMTSRARQIVSQIPSKRQWFDALMECMKEIA